MNPEDIKAVFGMQPEAAVAYLKQKGHHVSWDWQDMLDDAHATAFTVAKTAKMDVLDDIYSAALKALENGQTLEEFGKELTPVLQAKGWWGRKEVSNPDTGDIQTATLGSPHSLKTIYLTNMQSAYMAGRYAEMMESTDTHPYWEYVAINDERTRESHRLLHGKVYAATGPVWGTLYPPLDYRCRCRVKPLSAARGAAKVLPSPLTPQQLAQYRNEWRRSRNKDRARVMGAEEIAAVLAAAQEAAQKGRLKSEQQRAFKNYIGGLRKLAAPQKRGIVPPAGRISFDDLKTPARPSRAQPQKNYATPQTVAAGVRAARAEAVAFINSLLAETDDSGLWI